MKQFRISATMIITVCVAGGAVETQVTPSQSAAALHSQAMELCSRAQYVQCADRYAAAIQIWRTLGDSYRPHLAASLANLAEARQDTSNWSGAVTMYEEALQLSQAALGPKDLRTAVVQSKLAAALA